MDIRAPKPFPKITQCYFLDLQTKLYEDCMKYENRFEQVLDINPLWLDRLEKARQRIIARSQNKKKGPTYKERIAKLRNIALTEELTTISTIHKGSKVD